MSPLLLQSLFPCRSYALAKTVWCEKGLYFPSNRLWVRYNAHKPHLTRGGADCPMTTLITYKHVYPRVKHDGSDTCVAYKHVCPRVKHDGSEACIACKHVYPRVKHDGSDACDKSQECVGRNRHLMQQNPFEYITDT